MSKRCTRCGDYGTNPHCHGRDGTNLDLCDVCFWRTMAEDAKKKLEKRAINFNPGDWKTCPRCGTYLAGVGAGQPWCPPTGCGWRLFELEGNQ